MKIRPIGGYFCDEAQGRDDHGPGSGSKEILYIKKILNLNSKI